MNKKWNAEKICTSYEIIKNSFKSFYRGAKTFLSKSPT